MQTSAITAERVAAQARALILKTVHQSNAGHTGGALLVGPWYVLPDLFLVSGESIVRNLQLGTRVAEKFGGHMNVGYMPDQFGFPTQMPRILTGFGIDSAVAWRGFNAQLPSEIRWQSPDGSSVLAHKLEGKLGYFNAKDLDMESAEKARAQIEQALERLGAARSGSHVLLMNGVDHEFPDSRLPQVIDAVNGTVSDIKLIQSTPRMYLDAVRDEVKDAPIVQGEQRESEQMEMLQGTLSTRMYLKQHNERTETMLAHVAEPLCAFAWLLGAEYPGALIHHAWKELLKNHAHDSICGCSLDEVHQEMLTRFASAQQIAGMLSEHATKRIADALSAAGGSGSATHLLVVNTLPWKRTELVDVELRLPNDAAWRDFTIFNGECDIPYAVVSEDDEFVAFNAADSFDKFPTFDNCHRYTLRLLLEDIPGCGYRALEVRSRSGLRVEPYCVADFTTDNGMPGAETDSLRLSFNSVGTFDLRDKRFGLDYRGLHFFEDTGDCGDEYSYCPPDADSTSSSLGADTRVSLEVSGNAFRTYRIDYVLTVPVHLVRSNTTRRSDDVFSLSIKSWLTIAAGVPRVDIVTELENNARDHRLRVLFPTDVDSDYSFSETAFDIVKRSVDVPEVEGWTEDPQPTHPQLTFAGVASPSRSLTIGNRGLTEYEVRNDKRRTFALTLLRCVEWGSRGDLSNTTRAHREDGGDGCAFMYTPGAQCPGTHRFHYSVIPGVGDPASSLAARQAYNHKVPLVVHQRMLPTDLPGASSFVSTSVPASVVPSALKVAERDEMLIIRLANLSNDPSHVEFALKQGIDRAELLDLAERSQSDLDVRADDGVTVIKTGPKTILTLGLTPKARSTVVQCECNQ